MKFILPTQNAPKTEIQIGELKISPNKRVKIHTQNMEIYWDSMNIEFPREDWKFINEWLTFHNIILNDYISLEWYESENFNTDKLIYRGECSYLLNYLDISRRIYFPMVYSKPLRYEDLYKKYISQPKENKSLVKNYFNSFENSRFISLQRSIRNDAFWRILVLFSIVESIIGDIPKCPENVNCGIHGKIYAHNNMSSKEWIKHRLTEIISDAQRVEEYFSVIWEIRQKIRHKTVHEGAISEAYFIQQDEREIIYDWVKTSEEWNTNSTALSNLKIQMSKITRCLLLNKIFDLDIFPVLKHLHSTRIN